MYQKHCLLSVERRRYLEHSAAAADHSFRKRCSERYFADCPKCNRKTCRLRQTSNRPVEAEPVVEAGFDPEKQKGSCQNAEIAETAGSADRTAHTPFAQALISLAETTAVHSDCTGIVEFGIASLRHLARLDLAAVRRMVE